MKNKIPGIIAAAAMIFSSFPAVPADGAYAADNGAMRDITTTELIQDMGIGINLGNTFESCGDWIAQWGDGTPNAYETAWGSPTVTEEIIRGYAQEGFGTLRVPVAWSNMMADDGTYTINNDYKSRVKQVIDWALDSDMYVIMNLHWDGGWLENLPSDHDNCMKKYTAIWTQLCDEFGEYGDHLIFESQNEELGWQSVWNRWGGTEGKDVSFGYCNEVNQTFVDIVRNSGGNNAQRHLLISGYGTDIELTCDPMFKMPDDPAGRCAVSVHYYTPAGFAILEEDADWGKASSTWGTDSDYSELNSNFDKLKDTFTSKGIPVIVGEYGCPKKNKEEESVRRFLTSVCEAALSRGGICPVLWDITDLHYDRSAYKLSDTSLKAQFDALREKYLPEKQTEKITAVEGDVNADGEFNIADIVMLEKFLVERGELTDSQAADLCNDGVIDVFDMIMMRKLINN
ncbi:MAG: cellulase family glycosylhydrolase [Ruminococcus sp.]|nr:cellulase family glycosylhydrolase [Ruminococcus sp.]